MARPHRAQGIEQFAEEGTFGTAHHVQLPLQQGEEFRVAILNETHGDGIQVGQWLLVPENAGNPELASNPADEAARTVEVPVAQPVTIQDPQTSSQQVTQAPETTTPESAPPASASGRTHTVQAGETAWGISQKYKVKVDELLRVNGISDPSLLRIGTELKIP
jgi:LysM repeat protein